MGPSSGRSLKSFSALPARRLRQVDEVRLELLHLPTKATRARHRGVALVQARKRQALHLRSGVRARFDFFSGGGIS